MKIKDALDQHENTMKEKMPKHLKYLGISIGHGKDKITLTPEILASNDWGIVLENSKPEFKKLVENVIGSLKDQDEKETRH